MDAKLQRRVQRYGWDKAAEHYERYWARQLEPAQSLLLKYAALAPGERVLDIAAGSGLVTLKAAEAVGPKGAVVATDISEQMVALLRANAARLGHAHLTVERMEAEQLRLPDAAFDVVLCSLGLMYVTDPAASVSEMLRVLKPGGRMIAAVWGARPSCGWAEIFPIVERRVASEVCPLFFQLGGGDALRWTMEGAGFGDVAVERITTTLDYADGDDACGAAFAGGPVALAYARFDEQVTAEAHAEYLASIEAFRRGAGYAVPGEFVVARGTRPATG